MKKLIILISVGFFLHGCVVKNQDMYAEDALTDRHERGKSVDYAMRTYIGPVVSIPGAIVVGTIQGVGEVATYAANNPELIQQGIKTYQQVEYEQRMDQQRADRAYNEMQRTLRKNEEERRRASAQIQQRIQEKHNGSLGYSSSKPQTLTYYDKDRSIDNSSRQLTTQKKTTTNRNYNSSTYNTNTLGHKTQEKAYRYEFVEGMAFITRKESDLSGVRYGGKGPSGTITTYDTEEEALSAAGCENHHGVGHPHTYGDKSGKVYYCGVPLTLGFNSMDIDGYHGIGPGLTRGRKRWLCQDKALYYNSWQEKCKEI